MRGFLIGILFFAGLLSAQDSGKIIDKVVCSGNADVSYTLYLPSSYSRDRAWPILYCLDPLARGRVPVERFAKAAEAGPINELYWVAEGQITEGGLQIGWDKKGDPVFLNDSRLVDPTIEKILAAVTPSLAAGAAGAAPCACTAVTPASSSPQAEARRVRRNDGVWMIFID